jgi:hypothetical protein
MSILAHDFLPRHKETEIFEAVEDEPFVSPVDDENEAQLFQKPWDSPVSSRILRDSLGTVPVFEIFEADYPSTLDLRRACGKIGVIRP